MEDAAQKIRNTLKDWVSLDDEERELRKQIKILKDKKTNKENSESEDEKNNDSEGIKELFIKPKMKL